MNNLQIEITVQRNTGAQYVQNQTIQLIKIVKDNKIHIVTQVSEPDAGGNIYIIL